MVLAGLLASLKLVGGTLADHTFLFLGAGEVSFWGRLICIFKSSDCVWKGEIPCFSILTSNSNDTWSLFGCWPKCTYWSLFNAFLVDKLQLLLFVSKRVVRHSNILEPHFSLYLSLFLSHNIIYHIHYFTLFSSSLTLGVCQVSSVCWCPWIITIT